MKIPGLLVVLASSLLVFPAFVRVGATRGAHNDLEESIHSILDAADFRRTLTDIDPCEGAPEINYFDISITLEPKSGTLSDACTEADQVLLGHDLNVVLAERGLGVNSHENVYGIGAVCPTPRQRPREDMRRKLGWGFVYRGGYACGFFCYTDNQDARFLEEQAMSRDLQYAIEGSSEWFETVYAPQLELDIVADIISSVVANHQSCLENDPTVSVEVNGVDLSDLDYDCDDEGEKDPLEFLETTNLYKLGLGSQAHLSCSSCLSLDFSEDSAGFALHNGQYVKEHWKEKWAVTVSAVPGKPGFAYTPDDQARILDTSLTENEDPGLRSPNENCPGGGLGVGSGGAPGEPGENCIPAGNILIIQDWALESPSEASKGGTITFTFDKPVLFSDIGLMNMDEAQQHIRFHYANDEAEAFVYGGLGDNSVQRVLASKRHVVKVDVFFPTSGAITEINYCPECDFVCEDSQIISQEDFDGDGALDGWNAGRIATGEPSWTFSNFLGLYCQGGRQKKALRTQEPYKTYNVPTTADKILIQLDFYEIDSWDDEKADIYVDNRKIDLGTFNCDVDEGFREGSTSSGHIHWTMNSITTPEDLGFGRWLDQKHRIEIEVWKSSDLYTEDGALRLKLTNNLDSGCNDEAAGWDNIVVTALNDC